MGNHCRTPEDTVVLCARHTLTTLLLSAKIDGPSVGNCSDNRGTAYTRPYGMHFSSKKTLPGIPVEAGQTNENGHGGASPVGSVVETEYWDTSATILETHHNR